MLQRSNSFKRKVAQRARKDSATVPGGVVFKNRRGRRRGRHERRGGGGAGEERAGRRREPRCTPREGRPSAKSLFGRGGGAGAPAWEARHAVLEAGTLACTSSAKEITSFRGCLESFCRASSASKLTCCRASPSAAAQTASTPRQRAPIGLVNSTRSLAEGNAPGLRGHARRRRSRRRSRARPRRRRGRTPRESSDGGAFSPEKLAAQAAALEEAKASAAAAADALAAQRAAASDAAAGVAARLREVDAEIEAARARANARRRRARAAARAAAAAAARARAELNEIEAAMERAVDEVGVPGGAGGTDGGSWLEEVRKRRAAAAS